MDILSSEFSSEQLDLEKITVLLHTGCHRNKFVKKGSLGLNEQWYILRKVSVRKRLAPKFMLFINGIHSHIGFIRRRGEEEGQTPKKRERKYS